MSEFNESDKIIDELITFNNNNKKIVKDIENQIYSKKDTVDFITIRKAQIKIESLEKLKNKILSDLFKNDENEFNRIKRVYGLDYNIDLQDLEQTKINLLELINKILFEQKNIIELHNMLI